LGVTQNFFSALSVFHFRKRVTQDIISLDPTSASGHCFQLPPCNVSSQRGLINGFRCIPLKNSNSDGSFFKALLANRFKEAMLSPCAQDKLSRSTNHVSHLTRVVIRIGQENTEASGMQISHRRALKENRDLFPLRDNVHMLLQKPNGCQVAEMLGLHDFMDFEE
jgi:hypothetical protein